MRGRWRREHTSGAAPPLSNGAAMEDAPVTACGRRSCHDDRGGSAWDGAVLVLERESWRKTRLGSDHTRDDRPGGAVSSLVFFVSRRRGRAATQCEGGQADHGRGGRGRCRLRRLRLRHLGDRCRPRRLRTRLFESCLGRGRTLVCQRRGHHGALEARGEHRAVGGVCQLRQLVRAQLCGKALQPCVCLELRQSPRLLSRIARQPQAGFRQAHRRAHRRRRLCARLSPQLRSVTKHLAEGQRRTGHLLPIAERRLERRAGHLAEQRVVMRLRRLARWRRVVQPLLGGLERNCMLRLELALELSLLALGHVLHHRDLREMSRHRVGQLPNSRFDLHGGTRLELRMLGLELRSARLRLRELHLNGRPCLDLLCRECMRASRRLASVVK